jgi:hypothetical protein
MRPNEMWLMESLVRKNFLSKQTMHKSVIEVAKARVQDLGTSHKIRLQQMWRKLPRKSRDWEAWERTLEVLLQIENC